MLTEELKPLRLESTVSKALVVARSLRGREHARELSRDAPEQVQGDSVALAQSRLTGVETRNPQMLHDGFANMSSASSRVRFLMESRSAMAQ